MAVASNIDICNMALDHFGKPSIVSLSEGSAEAQACVRQYDIARRACLVRSPWTFARKLRKLAVNSVNPLPDLWEYNYDLPNDMLKLHQIVPTGVRPARNLPGEKYYVESGAVFSNVPDAYAFYIEDCGNVLRWSTLFDETVALALALRLAPTMTRRNSDRDTLQNMFRQMLNEAIENDAQQEFETYTAYEGGYIDARDTGRAFGYKLTDGSHIWED